MPFLLRERFATQTIELSCPGFSRDLTEDRAIITGNGVLDDRYIMLFQNLLHKEFPLMDGLV